MKNWKYYNHAMVPTCAPHENVDYLNLKKDILWKDKRVLFARYTTEFDCQIKTNWWFLIKDTPIYLAELNKKQRYEINKGLKNCMVRKINPNEYKGEIYNCHKLAINEYQGIKYNLNQEQFYNTIIENIKDKRIEYWGCFLLENDIEKMIGYAFCTIHDDYVEFNTLKIIPSYKKKAGTAALVYTLIDQYLNHDNKKYINDGERSIRHITNFQDYLEKYFGFRKAYCYIHIEYKIYMKILVKVLFPLKNLIKQSNNSFLHNIYSILHMEELVRGRDIYG